MALLNELISDGRNEKKAASFPVVMVHYSKLVPSESNNYSVDNIQELAKMVLLSGGIKQNLLVRKKTPDEYEVIAGHRRRLAVKYIVEELGKEEYSMVPVHVEKDGDLLSEVDLILTNCGARERSGWEKMMEVTRLTELLKAMQTGTEAEQERFRQLFGKEPGLGGRELRKVVAETLGLSETRVANLNHINSRLDPELKEKFRDGEIGVSVANEAAGLPPEKQRELAAKEEIRLADVKQKSVSESDTGKQDSEPEQGQQEAVGISENEKDHVFECLYDLDIDCPVILEECDEVCCEDCDKECVRRCLVAQRTESKTDKPVSDSDTKHREENLVDAGAKEKVEGCAVIAPEESVPEPTIDDIDLSVSAYNRLRRAGIEKLSEIRSMPDDELTKVRNMGKRELLEIREKVNGYYGGQEVLSAYGTKKKVRPDGSLLTTEGCEGGLHDCFSCAMDCRIRQKERHCMYAQQGNPFPCNTMNVLENLRGEVGDECQFINHELADVAAGSHEPTPCCMNCQNPCGYACARAAHREPGIKSALGIQDLEPTLEQDNPDVIDAEFTGTPLELAKTFDHRILQDMIRDTQCALDQMRDYWKENQPQTYTRYVMMVQAYQNLLKAGEEPAEEESEPAEQPELPIMKNNDQRKEWLANYRDWGLWYEDEHIGAKYYKYDFDNGAQLIVEEYENDLPHGGTYTSHYFHLVGGPEPPKHAKYGFGKWSRNERYNRYPNNETELAEFLKEIQKYQ